jgi:hypothetical protein
LRDKYPGIETIGEYLKNAIQRDKACTILTATFCQVIPNKYHRNTSSEADQYQTHHVFRIVLEEKECQRKHEDWPNDPVQYKGNGQDFGIPKYSWQQFIIDLCQGRIHHQNQPNSYRNVGRTLAKGVDESGNRRKQIADTNTYCHGQKYPKR